MDIYDRVMDKMIYPALTPPGMKVVELKNVDFTSTTT